MNPKQRKRIVMSLRAISATAVVLLLADAASLAAQDSSRVGPPTAVLVSGPQVGQRAPAFRLPWAAKEGVGPADQPYDLALDLGRTVVIAFYPRDFTSGCTAEMRTFAEQYDSLFGADVSVVGISTDSLESHVRFASSLNLPFRLLSDRDQAVAGRYGSKGDGGFNRRTVFVVGPDGKVRYRNLQFNALDPKDYAALSDAVRKARSG